MVKKIFTLIMQLIIIACCAVIIYFTYDHYIAKDKNIAGPYNSEIRFVYGKTPSSVKESGGTTSKIVYTDEDLNIAESISAKNTVFGDTVTSSTNSNYINQFSSIIKSTSDKNREVYPLAFEDKYIEVILQSPITVFDVYATDDYYQSISSVKLQSTLNYNIDGSVVSQIKDGRRTDFLIHEKVESVDYSFEKDLFYVTYVSSDDNNPLLKYSKSLKIQSYSWNEEIQSYLPTGEIIDTEIYPSTAGVLYSELSKENELQIFYSEVVNNPDEKIYYYYRIGYNMASKNKFDKQLVSTVKVEPDSTIKVVDSFKIRDTVYLFFDDLRYLKVNLVDKSVKEITIMDTGAVSNITFDNDGTNIYMMSSTNTNFILFNILDGVVVDKKVQSTRDLSSIFSNHNQIYDFSVKKEPITP